MYNVRHSEVDPRHPPASEKAKIEAAGGGWSRMGGPSAYASSSPRNLTPLDRNSAYSWRQTRGPVSDGPTGWSTAPREGVAADPIENAWRGKRCLVSTVEFPGEVIVSDQTRVGRIWTLLALMFAGEDPRRAKWCQFIFFPAKLAAKHVKNS